MEYINTSASYEPERELYGGFVKYGYLAFWLIGFCFIIPILIFPLCAMIGLVPWPWSFFKKGFWVGNCPACKSEKFILEDKGAMESEPMVCSCGAHFRLVNGSEYKYVEQG